MPSNVTVKPKPCVVEFEGGPNPARVTMNLYGQKTSVPKRVYAKRVDKILTRAESYELLVNVPGHIVYRWVS